MRNDIVAFRTKPAGRLSRLDAVILDEALDWVDGVAILVLLRSIGIIV